MKSKNGLLKKIINGPNTQVFKVQYIIVNTIIYIKFNIVKAKTKVCWIRGSGWQTNKRRSTGLSYQKYYDVGKTLEQHHVKAILGTFNEVNVITAYTHDSLLTQSPSLKVQLQSEQVNCTIICIRYLHPRPMGRPLASYWPRHQVCPWARTSC